MALHDKNTFIKAYSPGDTLVIIQDINSSVTYEIKPWAINSMFVRPKGKNIIIKQKGSNYNPDVEFSSYAEALQALTLLQTAVDLAKGVVDNIPDEIRNYIDNQVLILIESGKFVFRQELPSENWNVYNHKMDKRPSVTITNESFEIIEGYVQYIDDDNIEVKFNIPISGWVFLN